MIRGVRAVDDASGSLEIRDPGATRLSTMRTFVGIVERLVHSRKDVLGSKHVLARSMKHPGSRALLLTPASIGAIISIDTWFCPATRKRMKRAHEQY